MNIRQINLSAGARLQRSELISDAQIDAKVVKAAASIIDDVKAKGDTALSDYTAKFDKVQLAKFAVESDSVAALAEQYASEHNAVAAALQRLARNLHDYYGSKVPQSSELIGDDGVVLQDLVRPLASVGVYVPGGKAVYPSTVLMTAIPAKIAGVKRLVLVTPPQITDSSVRVVTSSSQLLHPAVALAAQIAGVDEIYLVGGAQAIAALAYGTKQIAPVDMIAGPGNAYVTAAKQLVSHRVGIDALAGPSELVILADKSAQPANIALDLMAQAEHDPAAVCILLANNLPLVKQVKKELERKLADSPRRSITEQALEQNGLFVIYENTMDAIALINEIAPEHLELQIYAAESWLDQIVNAGAVFVGNSTPTAVGDYIAGPNHTLPTGGTARFASPLAPHKFVKHSSIIKYSPAALDKSAHFVADLANAEGLWAHAQSVQNRL